MEFVINGNTLKKYIGSDSEVIIPDGVTEIGENAFSESSIMRVVLPKSIVRINQYAFYGTTQLSSIVLSPNLRFIGKGAFSRSGLPQITIPPKIRTIANELFSNSLLENITLPDRLSSIGYAAFKNCQNLVEINIPESVTQIDRQAFYCNRHLARLKINNPECAISANAFGMCDELSDSDGFIVFNGLLHESPALYIDEELVIPDSVTQIGDHALDCDGGCRYFRDNGTDITSFSKRIIVPPSVTHSFSLCNTQVEEIIYQSPINIRAMDYLGCINLRKIVLPKGCLISSHAFGIWKENARATRNLSIEYY